MKRIIFFMCLLLCLPVFAQSGDMSAPATPELTAEATAEAVIGNAEVQVESAFVRVLPSREAEVAASVFENDRLEVLGRNIDGLWFFVRRPNRDFNLGWIAVELLDYNFAPETLPMLDWTTGLIGTSPINPANMAVVFTAEANLRAAPLFEADILLLVPLGAVLPVSGRDTEGQWFYVNYRGTEGWVNSVSIRRPANWRDLPDLTFVPEPEVAQIAAPIIPPELQLSQLVAFRDYVQLSYDTANELAPFWEVVAAGEIMPCEPPEFVVNYLVSSEDVRELPELNRFVPRYNQGVTLLNEAIDPLYECGVLMPDVVLEARNDAINAAIIMSSTLNSLNFLEDTIRDSNGLDPRMTSTPRPTPTPTPRG
jgi:hypothetical protein